MVLDHKIRGSLRKWLLDPFRSSPALKNQHSNLLEHAEGDVVGGKGQGRR